MSNNPRFRIFNAQLNSRKILLIQKLKTKIRLTFFLINYLNQIRTKAFDNPLIDHIFYNKKKNITTEEERTNFYHLSF